MSEPGKPGLSTITLTQEGSTPAPVDVPNAKPIVRRPAPLQLRDIGRYEIVTEHGRGGLGRVMRAIDSELGRTVALKELLHRTRASELRFFQEALITAKLEHPNIVPVHEAGRWTDGTPFYAMKLVSGRSLMAAIENAKSLDERLALLPHVVAVADAISYAHSHGVIHRDLKPSNVVVGDYGETVVIDWGLAKDVGSKDNESTDDAGPDASLRGLTAAGAALGTPAYMPPEQERGEAGKPADVYALGAIIFTMVMGAPPPCPHDADERTWRTFFSRAPKDLARISATAMERDPDQRYPSVDNLGRDLRSYLNRMPVSVQEYGLLDRLSMAVARNRTAAGVAMLLSILVMLVSIAAVVLVRRQQQQTIAAERATKEESRKARASARSADLRAFELLLERSREAILAHNSMGGLALLQEASALTDDLPRIGRLFSTAQRALESRERYFHSSTTRVTRLVFSRSGDVVVGTGVSKAGPRGHVWDARTGKLLRDLPSGYQVMAIDSSPVADEVALGDSTGSVVVYEWRTGDVRVHYTHSGPVDQVRFAANGRLLSFTHGGEVAVVVGSSIRKWNAAVDRLDAHWLPDGTIATAGLDGRLVVWSVSGKPLRAYKIPPTLESAVDSLGKYIALIGEDGPLIHVRDLRDGHVVSSVRADRLSARVAAFVAGGDVLVTGGSSGSIRGWQMPSGTLVASADTAGTPVVAIAASRDGRYIATGAASGLVRLWESRSLRSMAVWEHHVAEIKSLQFSPDGSMVVSAGFDGAPALWRVAQQFLVQEYSDAFGLSDFDQDHAGNILLAGAGVHGVILSPSLRPMKQLSDPAAPVAPLVGPAQTRMHRSVALDAAGVTAAIGNGHELIAWRVKDGVVVGKCSSGDPITAVALSEDGGRLAGGNLYGGLEICDLTSSRRLSLKSHLQPGRAGVWPVSSVKFSPDGQYLAAVGQSATLDVFNAASGELLFQGKGHNFFATDVEFSPDGTRLATSSMDGTVRLWRLDGAVLSVFSVGSSAGTLAWSPDASLLAVGLDDGTIEVWEVDGASASGAVAVLDVGFPVSSVAFSRSGEQVVSVTDGLLSVWDFHPAELTPTTLQRVVDCLPFAVVNHMAVPRRRPDCSRN